MTVQTVSGALAQQAAELIEQDFPMLAGVDDLADRLGVSKCHLIRCFTAARGVSPGVYLTATRLSAVRAYLEGTDYTVDTIAGLTGFACGNYLAKVFRKATGDSPGSYRALHGGGVGGDTRLQKRSEDISFV